MSTLAQVNPKFKDLHDWAADAFATAVIFQKRAKRYRRLEQFLTFFGIAIPGTIGAVVLANLFQRALLDRLIWLASTLLIIQFVFSIWSAVSKWPESLDYSSASSANNYRLSSQLKALAVQAASPPADFEVRYTELRAWDEAQQMQDNTKDVSDFEKIYGHRAGLIQFERKQLPLWLIWQILPRTRSRLGM